MKKQKINFNDEEKRNLTKLIYIIKENFDSITQEIKKKLSHLLYENVYILPPWELNKYITEEVESFLNFLITNDKEKGFLRGKQAAIEGISKNCIFILFEVFQKFFKKYIPTTDSFSFFNIIIIYMKNYINSFIKEQATQIYYDQEQMKDAFLEIIEQQKEEILQKEKELNQQKTAFLINFAHEAKFPLTVLENQLNMTKEEAGNRPLQTFTPAISLCKAFREMVANMLDYEKVLQGKSLYKHKMIIDISKALKTKIELFKGILEKKEITIKQDIQTGLCVKIAPPALDRVISNIIDNAIKFNKPKGEIEITLQSNNSSVILIFRDTGYGIPPDKIQHLFIPYYQCTRTHKGVTQGIGAGLSLVKSILDEISGKITVHSIFKKETTVTITFKREIIKKNNEAEVVRDIKMTEPIRRMNITLRKEVYNEKKKTILFVEDNVEYISYLQKNLTDFNFYYELNGKYALQKLETIPKPDIIISDIMMDVMDGYEFLMNLREKPEMQDVPFIFLTAKSEESDKLKGFQLGAVDYIVKPFEISVLKEKIKALIRDRAVYLEKTVEKVEKMALEEVSGALEKAFGKKDNKQDFFQLKCDEYDLSDREREVLHYYLKGMDSKEIGQKLYITDSTIRTHIKKFKEKFNLASKSQIIKLFSK